MVKHKVCKYLLHLHSDLILEVDRETVAHKNWEIRQSILSRNIQPSPQQYCCGEGGGIMGCTTTQRRVKIREKSSECNAAFSGGGTN